MFPNLPQPDFIAMKERALLRWRDHGVFDRSTTLSNLPPTSFESATIGRDPQAVRLLWNVYGFFAIYAHLAGFDPQSSRGWRPICERAELDRWISSELAQMGFSVRDFLASHDMAGASRRLHGFLDALSNWYLRRCRSRFSNDEGDTPDNLDALWTLLECLLTFVQASSRFLPFDSDEIWCCLCYGSRFNAGEGLIAARKSVHLCDFPEPDDQAIDLELTGAMRLVREIAKLGGSARMGAKLRLRQPLAAVKIILNEARHLPWLKAHAELLAEELNVKEIEFPGDPAPFVELTLSADSRRLGPRLGPRLPKLREMLAKSDAASLHRRLRDQGHLELEVASDIVRLEPADVVLRFTPKPGWCAQMGQSGVVVLSTELTPDLVREGYARELVHLVSLERRRQNLAFTDRIEILLVIEKCEWSEFVCSVHHEALILRETLADKIRMMSVDLPDRGAQPQILKVAGGEIRVYVEPLTVCGKPVNKEEGIVVGLA